MSENLPMVAFAAAWAVFLCSLMGVGVHAFAAACLIVWLVERGDEVAREAAANKHNIKDNKKMRRRR